MDERCDAGIRAAQGGVAATRRLVVDVSCWACAGAAGILPHGPNPATRLASLRYSSSAKVGSPAEAETRENRISLRIMFFVARFVPRAVAPDASVRSTSGKAQPANW